MISVKVELPKIGETVRCEVNFWRHGAISHTDTLEAEYLGPNFLGRPMFDIETGDEAYPEVVSWERITK